MDGENFTNNTGDEVIDFRELDPTVKTPEPTPAVAGDQMPQIPSGPSKISQLINNKFFAATIIIILIAAFGVIMFLASKPPQPVLPPGFGRPAI